MKKLLIISLFIPLISFGQTANEFAKGGHEKFKLKDYYGAISDLTKAIEIKPNRGVYYSIRGDAKHELKDYYGAISDYTKSIEIDPNDEID
jgi:tetratricopeptide (TPR) repeat protein